jgi:hypothetical protein
MPEPFEAFRASVSERPGYRWVQEIFRRHRLPGGYTSSSTTIGIPVSNQ